MTESILIIDDEQRILQALARNLNLAGYTVFTTQSGQTGIESFARERPSITFVDVRMPDLDGFAVLEAIQAQEPDAEVILMTGHGDKDTIMAALRADATDRISKPIEREALESVLRRAQKRLHTKRELCAAQEALRASHAYLERQVAERTAELEAANAILHESEKQHRLLTEGVADMVWIFDVTTDRFRYLSPSLEQLCGYTPEEILPQAPDAIFSPDTLTYIERVTAERTQAFQQGEECDYRDEFELLCKDGSYIEVEVTSHYYLNSDNGHLETYGVSRDITARKRAEAAVQEQDERLRLLSDNLSNGYVYQLDLGHNREARRFTYLSAGVKKIHGISVQQGLDDPQAIFGQTVAEDLPRVAELKQMALAGLTSFSVEVRIQPPTGVIRWLHLASTLRQLPDGHFVAEGIALDITAHKQVEIALQQNAERYRKAQQLGHVGNWEYDIHTTEFWGSEEAKRIYGFSPDSKSFTTEEIETCIPDRENVHQALVDLIEHGRDYRLEFDIITRDTQERRTILSVAELEKDIEGVPRKVTGVIQDITERKQVEAAIAWQTHELQTLYEVSQQLKRTLDLEQIYATIHHHLHQLMPCDGLYISAYDATTQIITCRAGWNDCTRLDVSGFPPLPLNPEGSGTQSVAIHTGQSLLLNDYDQQRASSRARYYMDEQGVAHETIPDDAPHTRAALIVPLETEGQVTGVIQVFSNTLNAYSADHLRLLEALSTHIASALQNAALYQAVQHELTERKAAEAALRESEEKHRCLFETMAPGVIYQAADGTIISANPSAERILGLTFDQIRGKTSMDPRWKMVTEDGTQVPGTEHPAMIALRTGKEIGPVTRGVYIPEKDEYVWLSIAAIPLFRPGENEPYQVYATFEDITEHKLVEAALWESNRRLEAFLQISQSIAASLELDALMQIIVDNATKVMNIDSGAVYLRVNQDTISLAATTPALPVDFPAEFRLAFVNEHPHIKEAITSGSPVIMPDALTANLSSKERDIIQLRKLRSNLYIPIRLREQNLGVFILSSIEKLLVFDNKDVALLQSFADQVAQTIENARYYEKIKEYAEKLEIEISERKQAEQSLRESNERLLTVMNSIAAFIYIADMQTYELLFANEYARKSWGEDIIGQPCWKALQNNMIGPCPFCTNAKLLTTEGKPTGVYQWEFQNTHDGRWYDCRDSVIQWTDGRTVRMEIATDITERKQAEIVLRESLTEKTVLLQEVHHRVKNNLAMIIGLLNLQQFAGLEPIVEEQFQEFESRIRSIALIHEMLYQAELLSRVDFDTYLHALVVRLRDMFDPLNRIALHIAAPGIDLDPDLAIPCGLIVNELVTNALKYAFPPSRDAEAAPCHITATLEWDGTHYTLTVSDNGVGLPPGMDWQSQETLGLQLVHLLGEGQLHGQVAFTNKEGVTCQLRFAPENHAS